MNPNPNPQQDKKGITHGGPGSNLSHQLWRRGAHETRKGCYEDIGPEGRITVGGVKSGI